MNLVSYNSSDDSESDHDLPKAASTSRGKPSSKPTFQKLVDSSNPNKLRISLANSKVDTAAEDVTHEPPTKKIKVGGRGFQDFMASLPAPKRKANTASAGLQRGMSLKTGAAPAFTRELATDPGESRQADAAAVDEAITTKSGPDVTNGSSAYESSTLPISAKQPTIFRPLSVARKPQKKKQPAGALIDVAKKASEVGLTHYTAKAAPKPALFSNIEDTSEQHIESSTPTTKPAYQTMLYQNTGEAPTPGPGGNHLEYQLSESPVAAPQELPQNESLDDVASSLNLTASQRRQLMGRHAGKSSAQAIKVTNFNTDAEYAANESLRQSGETVQHHALRPIAGGGKHSLKQLVSSAVGQKEALEEKFAEGNRNRKEGANRYGW